MSVRLRVASTVLSVSPELRIKYYIRLCFIDILKLSKDTVIFWSFFAMIPGNGLPELRVTYWLTEPKLRVCQKRYPFLGI
jgi:hypothetical protein